MIEAYVRALQLALGEEQQRANTGTSLKLDLPSTHPQLGTLRHPRCPFTMSLHHFFSFFFFSSSSSSSFFFYFYFHF